MDWRSRLRSERSLLIELALLLAAMLVVGLYFLERLETGLQSDQRRHLQALAQYLAVDSADYLAADNRVSLGVIARQAARLETVAAVAVRDTSDRTLARAGAETTTPAPVQQPVRSEAGAAVGRVQLWPEASAGVQRRVESGFAVVVLLLLALRVLGEVIRRRLWPGAPAATGAASAPSEPEDDSGGAPVRAHLWFRTPNAEQLRARYTPSVVNRVLADYQAVLDEVVRYHGAHQGGPLDGSGCLTIAAPSAGDALFQALCAGELLFESTRRLAHGHGNQGPAPALQMLASLSEGGVDQAVLEAMGEVDGLYVPADELARTGLTERLAGTEGGRVTVEADGQAWTLQRVERLNDRYESLIRGQAGKLVPGSPPDPA